jgi:colanic acid/amylovoran biosynthesis protein
VTSPNAPEMVRRVLVDFYAVNNLGDDLLLKVLLDRFPQVEFLAVVEPPYRKVFASRGNLTCLDSPVSHLTSRLRYLWSATLGRTGEFDHRCRVWRDFYRRLSRSVDGYVHLGGSIFMEPSVPKVHEEVYEEKIVNFRDRATLVIDANFGPFRSESYHERYRRIFSNMTAVSFRDRYSCDLFAELGNVYRAPDLAFCLALPAVPRLSGSVAFAPIDLTGRAALREHALEYVRSHTALVRAALRKGMSAHLFSFCRAEGDERTTVAILDQLTAQEREQVEVVVYKDNIDNFLARYAQMQWSVPTRFHAVVLSLIAGQRVLPICYSDKTRQSLSDLAFSGPVLGLDELSAHEADELLARAAPVDLSIDRIAAEAGEHCRLLARALSLSVP